MKHAMKNAALALALTGAFGMANATVLTPNVLTSSVDITPAFFGGTLLNSAITNVSNLSYNGIARTAVYQTSTGLDFYYQFSNNSTSKNGIERFTAFDFSSLGAAAVDVFQTSQAFGIFTAGTEASSYADRTTKNVVGFSFVPNGFSKIQPGVTSYTQIIRTNAHNYVAGNFGLLDGIGDNARGFAPAVPEPATNALLLSGLGMIGFIGRRRLSQGASALFSHGAAEHRFA